MPLPSDEPMPSIVVDIYVNTGETQAQIQEIMEVVYESVHQTLVLDKSLKDKVG